MITASKSRFRLMRGLVTSALVVAVGVIGVLNGSKLRTSFHIVKAADWQYISLAVVLLAVTFLLAAGIYQLLALRRLRYGQTVLVEVAAAAANRTLPAGLGSLGLHGVYLYKRNHTVAQSTAVVSVNNLLGIAAHLLLLVGVVVLWRNAFRMFDAHTEKIQLGWVPVVLLGMIGLLLAIPPLRQRLFRFGDNLLASLRLYTRHPRKIMLATLLAICLTVTYTAILFVCARALRNSIAPVVCFIVFSIGMLVGTATPTPGGLVGAEAGLFTGFVAYGVSSENALAVTLLFRLITYWLPLLPGAVALVIARQRRML